jgi:transposase
MTKNHKDLDLENSVPEQGLFLTPFQHKLLIKNLQEELCPEHQHRIEIMMLADRGHSQAQIRKILGCSQETVRYWVAIAKSGQAHLWSEFTVGRPKSANQEYCRRLQELVEQSPRDYGYAFQRWTAMWLSKHLAKELGISISDRHINRLLKAMGLSTRKQAETNEPNASLTGVAVDRVVIHDLPYAHSLQQDGSGSSFRTSELANESNQGGVNPSLFQVMGIKSSQSLKMDWSRLSSLAPIGSTLAFLGQ